MSIGLRHCAKGMVAHGLSPLWHLSVRAWAQRGATLVLAYHRVIEEWDETLEFSQPGMVVTAQTLDQQLAFLREYFDVVALSDVAGDSDVAEPARRPRCVVTFDDGWRDNYDVALPILRQHGVPATVFVTTDFIGTDRAFWHTELVYLLLRTDWWRALSRTALSWPTPVWRELRRTTLSWPTAVWRELHRLAALERPWSAHDVDRVIETIKASCDDSTIEQAVSALAEVVGLHRPFVPRRSFLDWTQLREMAALGLEVGSHGCSHRMLTRLSSTDAATELMRSKAVIERHVGRDVRHFAFPNEAANATLLQSVAAAGYRSACLGRPIAGIRPRGLRVLQRVGMHEGVCSDGRTFDAALLRLALYRAPKGRA